MHAGLDKIYFDHSQTRHQQHLPPMQATPPFIERRENLFFWRRRSRFFPPRTSVHASSDPCGDVWSIIQPLEIAYHTSDPAFLSQSWQKRKVRAGLGIISFSSTCLARGEKLKNSGTVKQNSGADRSLCPLQAMPVFNMQFELESLLSLLEKDNW